MEITRRQCEICGTELKEGEIKCPICQHENTMQKLKTCPNCLKSIPQISKYCPNCGVNVGNMATEDFEEQKPKYPDPFLAYNQTPSPEHGNEGYNTSDTSASNTKNQITENQRTNFSEGEAAGEDLRTQLARRQRESTVDQSQKEPGVSETTKKPEDTVTSSWWVGPQAPKSSNWTINSDGHIVSVEQKAPEQPDWQDPSPSTMQPNWQNQSAPMAQSNWQNQSASMTQSDWQNQSAPMAQSNWQNQSASMTQSDWQNQSAPMAQSNWQNQSASIEQPDIQQPSVFPGSAPFGQQDSFIQPMGGQQPSILPDSEDNQTKGSFLRTVAEQERWLQYLASNLEKLNEIQGQNSGSVKRREPEKDNKKSGWKVFNKKDKG